MKLDLILGKLLHYQIVEMKVDMVKSPTLVTKDYFVIYFCKELFYKVSHIYNMYIWYLTNFLVYLKIEGSFLLNNSNYN